MDAPHCAAHGHGTARRRLRRGRGFSRAGGSSTPPRHTQAHIHVTNLLAQDPLPNKANSQGLQGGSASKSATATAAAQAATHNARAHRKARGASTTAPARRAAAPSRPPAPHRPPPFGPRPAPAPAPPPRHRRLRRWQDRTPPAPRQASPTAPWSQSTPSLPPHRKYEPKRRRPGRRITAKAPNHRFGAQICDSRAMRAA